VVGAGAIGIQIELLLLDAVFHIAAGAVELVVEALRVAGETGDHEPRVAPDAIVLGLDEQTA